MALVREWEELGNEEDAVFGQLRKTKPTTLVGVIAMLDLAAGDLKDRGGEFEIVLVEPAFAGLREIEVHFVPELAPLAAHAAVSDHQVETPVIGFGEPGEGSVA